jgi:hypothetical protein
MSLSEQAPIGQPSGLSRFIVDLMKMKVADRMKASAEKAAKRYGIRQDWADWWIGGARRCEDVWPMRNGRVK